jgi:plastocyanin
MVHNVVGAGGLFRSKALDTNDKFSFTFDKSGEYAYFCGLHPFMKGKVIVAP